MPHAKTPAGDSASIRLSYESPFHPPTSELDHEFEIAWAKSLRSRFLWYCGVSIGLSAPVLLGLVLVLLLLPMEILGRQESAIVCAEMSVSLALYVAAWWYAYRMPPQRRSILALAFWLYVIASILSLIFARFPVATKPIHLHINSTSQPTTHAGRVTIDPTSRPVSTPTPPSGAIVFAFVAPLSIFINHLFLCLFLPWSFRQSVRPAMVILGAATAISLLDVAFGQIGARSLISPLLVMVAFVPGSVWCWWRFSRFRTRFKLYYESSAYQKLQTEMGNARRIHESQLPAMYTDGQLQLYYAYEPMRQLGGDLLFAYPPAGTPTTRLTAIVFDVTGHGIAAALFVNRLVGELERCFGEDPNASPDDVLVALNNHVYYTLAKHSMYVTAIAVQLDLESDSLRFASAGHPDAFLLRDGAETQRLASTTYMLGVVEPRYFTTEPVTMPFEKGTAVVIYTDGAIEAQNAATGQALGTAGLQGMVDQISSSPCKEWPQALLSGVSSFRQSPPEDDTLIVTMCRE